MLKHFEVIKQCGLEMAKAVEEFNRIIPQSDDCMDQFHAKVEVAEAIDSIQFWCRIVMGEERIDPLATWEEFLEGNFKTIPVESYADINQMPVPRDLSSAIDRLKGHIENGVDFQDSVAAVLSPSEFYTKDNVFEKLKEHPDGSR